MITPSQSALNITLDTWNIFYNCCKSCYQHFVSNLNTAVSNKAVGHMTDIPTVTFYNKIHLAVRTVSS